jgi:hypothetical protein
MTYPLLVHTVVETPEYLKASARAGMSDEEREAVVDFISANPEAGIVLDGGIRKARVPGRGKGKSGGYRVITYYMDEAEPVFLLTVISKGQQANLTENQKASLKKTAKDEKQKRGRP